MVLNRIIFGIIQDGFTIDPLKNIEIVVKWLNSSYREADLVILPEYSMVNVLAGLKPIEVYDKAEYIDDSTYLSKMSDIAGKYGVAILTHFIEKTDVKPYSYSSSILVKPTGEYVKIYSKIHLFNAYGYRESDYFLPGNNLSKPIVLNNMLFYVAICYDIRFPELFRMYAFNNATGVIVQSGWVKGFMKEEVLDKLASSRSHENTMYIILVDQVGELYVGRSGVFNPYGYRELDLGFKPGYKEYSIDPAIVDEARRQIPVVEESRRRWSIVFKG